MTDLMTVPDDIVSDADAWLDRVRDGYVDADDRDAGPDEDEERR